MPSMRRLMTSPQGESVRIALTQYGIELVRMTDAEYEDEALTAEFLGDRPRCLMIGTFEDDSAGYSYVRVTLDIANNTAEVQVLFDVSVFHEDVVLYGRQLKHVRDTTTQLIPLVEAVEHICYQHDFEVIR